MKRILRWTQRLLLACAIPALAYCGFILIDAWLFLKAQSRPQFERPPSVTTNLINRIEVPRLGLSALVIEGTGSTTLHRAAGHISGTGLPGQPGNIGIAGHRDTFFRPLKDIRAKDIITLTTLLGQYRYRVVSTRIVAPSDVAVLDPNGNEILTLVTCYPFYFIGSAPRRFIVRAERVT